MSPTKRSQSYSFSLAAIGPVYQVVWGILIRRQTHKMLNVIPIPFYRKIRT